MVVWCRCKRRRVAGDGAGAAAERGGEMSGLAVPTPPLSAAEALSALLWQPYECRSPPLARSHTDGALAFRGGAAARAPQSPNGGRHARASSRAIPPRPEMRLPVPAPAPLRESVSVRVPGEPTRPNVSNVNIVQVQDAPPGCNVNSAVQTDRERSVASAECQTEEPRRRRPRRPRAPRVPELLESVPPPPYSTLPPQAHLPVPMPVPVAVHPPPSATIIAPQMPAPRFPFQPIPLR